MISGCIEILDRMYLDQIVAKGLVQNDTIFIHLSGNVFKISIFNITDLFKLKKCKNHFKIPLVEVSSEVAFLVGGVSVAEDVQ